LVVDPPPQEELRRRGEDRFLLRVGFWRCGSCWREEGTTAREGEGVASVVQDGTGSGWDDSAGWLGKLDADGERELLLLLLLLLLLVAVVDELKKEDKRPIWDGKSAFEGERDEGRPQSAGGDWAVARRFVIFNGIDPNGQSLESTWSCHRSGVDTKRGKRWATQVRRRRKTKEREREREREKARWRLRARRKRRRNANRRGELSRLYGGWRTGGKIGKAGYRARWGNSKEKETERGGGVGRHKEGRGGDRSSGSSGKR
jgi:hypothetical protein